MSTSLSSFDSCNIRANDNKSKTKAMTENLCGNWKNETNLNIWGIEFQGNNLEESNIKNAPTITITFEVRLVLAQFKKKYIITSKENCSKY